MIALTVCVYFNDCVNIPPTRYTMAIQVSDKVILITESNELVQPAREALEEYGLALATDQLNLHSLSIIRSQIRSSGKTSFIREELKKFIETRGYPYAIILDARIDSGLGDQKDPDRLMFFKTILFTLIVLSKSIRYKNLRSNILLLADANDLEYMKDLTRKPLTLLELFVMKDPKVNKLLHEYKKDLYSFSSRFTVDCMDRSPQPGEFIEELKRRLTALKNRENLDRIKSAGSSLDSTNYEAARVIYRLDENRVYVDGTLEPGGSPEYEKFFPGAFYVQGSWTNRTHLEVSKKLTRAITGGLSGERDFTPHERIDIHLDDESRVDGATPMSMAGLLSKELKQYPEIRFHAKRDNYLVLSKSPGFSLIKKNVIRED